MTADPFFRQQSSPKPFFFLMFLLPLAAGLELIFSSDKSRSEVVLLEISSGSSSVDA